jgi:uncharacterized RDD family membrane protein YckC
VSRKPRSAGPGQQAPGTSQGSRQANATRLATAPGTAAPGTAAPGTAAPDDRPEYPGKRFGLPERGPMSVAPMGRRVAAIIVDWVLCELIVSGLTRHSILSGGGDAHYYAALYGTLILFAVEVYLLTAISGLTVGKRLLGIRVIRTDGGRPGFGWALLRTVLLLFVVPALLSDRDLRGLHDRAADTIVVRM